MAVPSLAPPGTVAGMPVRWWSVLAAGAAVVLLGSGCGSATAPVGGAAATTTPPPRGACPLTEQAPVSCVPYDPDAAMRQNDGYRQRSELSAADRALAEPHRDRIADVLADALGEGPLTEDRVVDVLGAAGYPDVQTYGRSDAGGGLAVGVSAAGGCVVGGVRGTAVELEAASFIADGGCLPARGH